MSSFRRSQRLYFNVAIVLGFIGYLGLTKPAMPPPGTDMAARLLAAKYVGLKQGADPVRVIEAPIIQAGRATVKTVFGRNKGCTVRMALAESEKEYGWLIEGLACGEVN